MMYDQTIIDRFWPKVDKQGPILVRKLGRCWVWIGAHHDAGYGRFWNGTRVIAAHRFALEIEGIDPGEETDHLCRNPPCVRWTHLEGVTHRINTQRGIAGQAQLARTHCPRGHLYATNLENATDGKRRCRICRNVLTRARQHGLTHEQIPDEWWKAAVDTMPPRELITKKVG